MKIRRIYFALGMIFFLGLFFFLTPNVICAKPIKLSYASHWPVPHPHGKASESWIKEIEKRTNGKVKFTYYPGNTLLNMPKMFDGVIQGISDVGESIFAFHKGAFPGMNALELPLGYPSATAATKLINDFLNELKPKDIGLQKCKFLYLHAHGPVALHSKKPINTMEDLRGMKVRCSGASAPVLKALGAVPVAMPQPEAYEALAKGVVDANMTPYETLKFFNQAEVTDYSTDMRHISYTVGFWIAMNLDKWNSLPDDVKKVFEEVSKEWIPVRGEVWDSVDKESFDFSVAEGHKMIQLSDDEKAKWKTAVQPVSQEYIKNAEAKGVPGSEYLKFIEKWLKNNI